MLKFDFFPNPLECPKNRLFCLDVLRGLDMFYLVVGGAVLPPLLGHFPMSRRTFVFFTGHPWAWVSMWDIIMPLFIFMSGAAVPFALGRRLNADGRPTIDYWRHVIARFALLWVLGMLSQGALTSLRWTNMSIYSNTLQAIAIGYFVAAIVFPLRRWWVKVALPIVLLVIYTLLIHFGGGYDIKSNLAQHVDLAVWRAIFPTNASCIAYTEKYGYVWILPSFMFPVLALAGCYATQILCAVSLTPWKRALWTAVMGVGALVAGWGFSCLGVQTVKHIFTSSFTLLAIGWSTLLLSALYVITDIWRFRYGMGLLLLFGQFALTAYLCECAFQGLVTSLAGRFFHGVYGYCPESWVEVVKAIAFSLMVIVILVLRRWLSIGRKV